MKISLFSRKPRGAGQGYDAAITVDLTAAPYVEGFATTMAGAKGVTFAAAVAEPILTAFLQRHKGELLAGKVFNRLRDAQARYREYVDRLRALEPQHVSAEVNRRAAEVDKALRAAKAPADAERAISSARATSADVQEDFRRAAESVELIMQNLRRDCADDSREWLGACRAAAEGELKREAKIAEENELGIHPAHFPTVTVARGILAHVDALLADFQPTAPANILPGVVGLFG